ncbi:MAG: L,D-transpeptidase, partial [Armatimonadetes bacterium]|nr:L,D-transpeptidase [Armatimonadota bacterium]
MKRILGNMEDIVRYPRLPQAWDGTMVRRFVVVLTIAMASLAALAQPGIGQEGLSRSLARLAPVFGQAQLYPRTGTEDVFAVARRFGVSASSVYNANVGDLLLGDELLLIPGEHVAPLLFREGVVVNLAERNLYYYAKGRPVRAFPAAIGKRGWETPTGD